MEFRQAWGLLALRVAATPVGLEVKLLHYYIATHVIGTAAALLLLGL
jgi:hypothetical protein